MSCWREQKVLRMPAKTVGIHTDEEWYQFERDYEDVMSWYPGYFAPSLCTSKYGRFIDYFLEDQPEVLCDDGSKTYARPLTPKEKEEYLPVFQNMFPGFTMDQMDEVHYCEYTWYDGSDAPYCY